MRTRLWALAAILAACACGGEPDVGVGVTIQGLNPSQIGAVQISVLKNGSSFDCTALSQSCLDTEVSTTSLVKLTLSDNKQHLAALLPADGAQVAGSGQPFTLQIPVGSNYLVVAEVLSTSQTQLLASGCDLRSEVVAGTNPPESITARALATVPSCDPRWEK